MVREYKHLSEEERTFFVEHGYLKVANAIEPKYLKEYMSNLWVRMGYDEKDKSTWKETYVKLPRHREVPIVEFCPKAWGKMLELVGGEEVLDPVRETHYGDQLIINFGSEELKRREQKKPVDAVGWHTDNDWYRQFLDSSNNALTVICCFTDIPKFGGGTVLVEDGIKGICQYLYDHPEGLDPPFEHILYNHIPECKKFTIIEAKAGDMFLTHNLLPHTFTENHLHYARVITNPHLDMKVPYNLNRADGDYTLCEQVILHALNRESIPEYHTIRARTAHYPRTAYFKRARIAAELERMIADAQSRGLGPESVDSVYLKSKEDIAEHERRNGYDKEYSETGVLRIGDDGKMETIQPTTKFAVV